MDITSQRYQPAVLLWHYRYENYYNFDEILTGIVFPEIQYNKKWSIVKYTLYASFIQYLDLVYALVNNILCICR